MIVVLDTGPLGMVANPLAGREAGECISWLKDLITRGIPVRIPEIADYELRRELLRARRQLGIERLDQLEGELGYLPITTAVILRAAEFWATARQMGQPTAGDKELDGDMILCAQADSLMEADAETVVATTNVGHLARFVQAKHWRDI